MGFVVTDEERVFCCVVRGLINLPQGRVFLFCDGGSRSFLCRSHLFSLPSTLTLKVATRPWVLAVGYLICLHVSICQVAPAKVSAQSSPCFSLPWCDWPFVTPQTHAHLLCFHKQRPSSFPGHETLVLFSMWAFISSPSVKYKLLEERDPIDKYIFFKIFWPHFMYGMQDLGSLIKDRTHTPCFGSVES